MARVERESINFKLPKLLVEALRSAAQQRNTSATDLVIEGLHLVMGAVPGLESSKDIRLIVLEEELANLAMHVDASTDKSREIYLTEKVSNLEGKLEVVMRRLEQVESTVSQVQQNSNASRSRYRTGSGGNPYLHNNSQPPQPQPFDEVSLARRLNTKVSILREKRTTRKRSGFCDLVQGTRQ